MDESEITELLDQIRAKLRSDTLTETDRQLLTRLTVDLEALLAQSGRLAAGHHRSLVERLQESITRFEVSHPDLTSVMERVSKTLADMGI